MASVYLLGAIIVATIWTTEGTAASAEFITKEQFTLFLRRLDELEVQGRHQQQEIDSLRAEAKLQNGRVGRLETMIRGLKMKNKKLMYALARPLPQEDDSKIAIHGIIKQDNEGIKKERKRRSDPSPDQIRRAENEAPVAFFSTLNKHLEHAGVGQSIPFEKVVTNVGGAYNPHFGSFVAPVSGIYVFSVTLMANGNHNTHYKITKNGGAMSFIYLRGLEAPYTVASQTAVLLLTKGDDVSVQNIDADEILYGDSYSTFSGFLLQEIYPSSPVVG